jgi:CubicO group peptidase (beta-lactamase class C family)
MSIFAGAGSFAAIEAAVAAGCDVSRNGPADAMPGCSVALVSSGKIVHTASGGHCRVSPSDAPGDLSDAVDGDTCFMTASISKTCVAISCLQAAERGELDLDQDIAVVAAEAAGKAAESMQAAQAVLTETAGPGDAVASGLSPAAVDSMAKSVSIAASAAAVTEASVAVAFPIDLAMAVAAARNPHFPDAPVTARHLLTHTAGLRDDEEALVAGSPWRGK